MLKFTKIRRIFKVKIAKIGRAIRYGAWSMKHAKTPQERMSVRIVKVLLERKDSFVFYSPEASKIYLRSKDRKYIIVYDRYSIKIANHKYFFTYSLREDTGDEIIKYAFDRLERDRKELEADIEFNEKNFLQEVYNNFTKSNKHHISTNNLNQPE